MVAQGMSADALAPGLRLGRYELMQRIAVGGMAEIYLARATGIEGFEKLVVLKRILPQFARNADFVSMFLDEARLSATLQHPNIAQVHDIGQYGDSYFFTMEYIRGEDVRSILKTAIAGRKRVPLANALTIIAGAAAGLHAAHEKRAIDGTPLEIVHRDVSPSNVLVSYDGAVKLVDFGVAKAAQRQTETAAGTLKGKVSYMSPEQCRAKRIDRRSDVFALGILLYELTLHRRLFKGDSEFEIMTKIVNEDVGPPSAIMPKYPAALERILLRSLERDPAARYQTAQEMQLDLEEFARSHALALSAIGLGAYMQELFVDQMRAQEAAIRRRPSTAEVGPRDVAVPQPGELAGPVADDLEVEIELGDDADLEIAIEMPPTRIGHRTGSTVAGERAGDSRTAPSRAGRWLSTAGALIAMSVAAVLLAGVIPSGSEPSVAPAAAPRAAAPGPHPSPAEHPSILSEARPAGATESKESEARPAEATESKESEARPAGATESKESAPAPEHIPTAEPAADRPESKEREAKERESKQRKRSPARRATKPASEPAPARKAAAPAPSPAPEKTAAWSLDSPLPPPNRKK